MTYRRHQLAIRICSLALLGGLGTIHAQQQVAPGQEIVTLPGDNSVHSLTLNSQIATTMTFPEDISLITGYGLVLDANKAQEIMDSEKLAATNFRELPPLPVTIIHYTQAAPDTLVMRAVRKGSPCFMTVRCGTKFFLFRIQAGEQANLAVIVADPATVNPTVEVKKDDILKTRIAFNSSELLGILSKAKAREFLQTVNPSLYAGWQQRRDLNLDSESEGGKLHSVVTEVQQWPLKDALVLRCKVQNKSERAIRFQPGDVKVRVADRSYPVQLADSSGIVAGNGTTLLDVVLQGNAAGGKEHLSIQNDFRLEVVASTTRVPPRDVLPEPNPLLPSLEDPKAPLPDYGANTVNPAWLRNVNDKDLPQPHFYPTK